MTGRVGIAGAGLIGRAWAMVFARAGWEVRLWDPADGVAGDAVPLCAEGLRDLAGHGLCDDPAGAAARIAVAGDLAGCVADASFVQECGPEQLSIKRASFAALDGVAPRLICTRVPAGRVSPPFVQTSCESAVSVVPFLSPSTNRMASPAATGLSTTKAKPSAALSAL